MSDHYRSTWFNAPCMFLSLFHTPPTHPLIKPRHKTYAQAEFSLSLCPFTLGAVRARHIQHGKPQMARCATAGARWRSTWPTSLSAHDVASRVTGARSGLVSLCQESLNVPMSLNNDSLNVHFIIMFTFQHEVSSLSDNLIG